MGQTQDYQNALEEADNPHWQNRVRLYPAQIAQNAIWYKVSFRITRDLLRDYAG